MELLVAAMNGVLFGCSSEYQNAEKFKTAATCTIFG
jgi:hypothetical protein